MNNKPQDELKQLLLKLSKSNVASATDAFDALLKAAEHYKDSRPSIDESGTRSKLSTSKAREGLRSLQKKLLIAKVAALDLPANAISVFCDFYENPKGKLVAELERAMQAADQALQVLQNRPDKTTNYDRLVLAYQVAVVLRDTLKLNPSSTRDTAINVTGKKNGAAYARTLRATLKMAGVSQVDIGPLINGGLQLLSDPDLPHKGGVVRFSDPFYGRIEALLKITP